MYERILNYCLGIPLISALCRYPKHRNRLLNISYLVDIMTNTQDPVKATTTTKTSQKSSNPSQKHRAALLGRRTKGNIIQGNIRGKTFQFRYEKPFSKAR